MKKMKMDDDFQNYLVEGAIFDGDADIPCMLTLNNIVIPKSLAPYTARKRIKNKNVVLHCFIHDFQFSNLITETRKHVEELTEFDGIICPDPTITIGGSKTINQAQIYFSRAVGFYLQKNGVFAVPCIRWGDQSTYDYCFLGVPKNYIVAISTHGCIMPCRVNNNELRNAFIKGLPVMLERLKPKYVIVYGGMPDEIFGPYKSKTQFIHFDSDLQNYFNKRKAAD
ncbi:MAG: DUF4417 domain-containing protein [Bacilli bacterium]|nr:DUF4417 domain-containing protein [Bacilli bacterium]